MSEKTKEQLEREHSEQMNAEAVERIKQEMSTTQESEETWFETGREVKLLDGKIYELRPVKLGKAQKLMKLLGSISIDVIILNFLDTGDEAEDNKRISNVFEALEIAMSHYPEINKEYLDENCDIEIAKQIIETTIGLNRIQQGKK